MSSKRDVPVILQPATQMLLKQRQSLVGKHSMESKICVLIHGDGRAIIRMDTKISLIVLGDEYEAI